MSCYSGTQFRCLQHNPLWQWVSQSLLLQQIVERDGSIWNRNSGSNLQLEQTYSDFYDNAQAHNVSLVQTVTASVERPMFASSSLVLIDSLSVSGGRFSDGQVEDPLEAEFVSLTLKGMPLYVMPDGTLELANASTPSTCQVVVFAFEDTAAGQIGQYITEGQITRSNWSPLTGTTNLSTGAFYYLAIVDGQISITAPSSPGESVLSVGRALSNQTLDIEITRPILL